VSLLGVAVSGTSACTSSTIHVGADSDDGGIPSLVPLVDAGHDGDVDAGQILACMGTECPAGYATCLSGVVGTAPYKCGTDLKRDDDNCGECGNKCLLYIPLHMSSRCIEGACEFQCYSGPENPKGWENCNDKIDDGCETDVLSDTNNCGVCGNVCPAGDPCIEGKCGCPPGKIVCDGECVDPLTDDQNCGSCGNSCYEGEHPDKCVPFPPNTYYGCKQGTCGMKCFGPSADCNNDLPTAKCSSDGCEIWNIETDLNNCGGCGIKCAPGEECITESGETYCGILCARYDKTRCGYDCVDLLNDVRACGSCGNGCRAAGPHQTRSCQKGLCVYECEEGFADCNGDPGDGCEANLHAHPENCGACGNRCNMEAGQPCVDGACLMVDCGPPEAR
jgi:hypothetical protein